MRIAVLTIIAIALTTFVAPAGAWTAAFGANSSVTLHNGPYTCSGVGYFALSEDGGGTVNVQTRDLCVLVFEWEFLPGDCVRQDAYERVRCVSSSPVSEGALLSVYDAGWFHVAADGWWASEYYLGHEI